MGLRFTSTEDKVALFDSVTGWAFGPVFDTEVAAERFLQWSEDEGIKDGDVRALSTKELWELWVRYSRTVVSEGNDPLAEIGRTGLDHL